MIDIRTLRENPEKVKEAMKKRLVDTDIGELIALDKKWRSLKREEEMLRKKRNEISRRVNSAKGAERLSLIREAKVMPGKIKKFKSQRESLGKRIKSTLECLPNITHESVPLGETEEKAKIVRQWGKLPTFPFKPKAHWELGEALGILDLERSALMAGSGYYVLKGIGARLERALINLMLDFHEKHGFTEVVPPLLVLSGAMYGTSQLPKFEEDLFKTCSGSYLIPTAEVPLANMHAGETLEEKKLPLKYCAFTPCFRKEAGKHGKETRGIFRLHQFSKVEMVAFTTQERSYEMLEELRGYAEKLLELLEVPYRTRILPSGDMSFASAKTYDIECYAAAQNRFLEVSSVSNCTDFQARRMRTKYNTGKETKFVHTLNASGLALPRLVISLLENNQTKEGTVKVPKKLQPHLGIKEIKQFRGSAPPKRI